MIGGSGPVMVGQWFLDSAWLDEGLSDLKYGTIFFSCALSRFLLDAQPPYWQVGTERTCGEVESVFSFGSH